MARTHAFHSACALNNLFAGLALVPVGQVSYELLAQAFKELRQGLIRYQKRDELVELVLSGLLVVNEPEEEAVAPTDALEQEQRPASGVIGVHVSGAKEINEIRVRNTRPRQKLFLHKRQAELVLLAGG